MSAVEQRKGELGCLIIKGFRKLLALAFPLVVVKLCCGDFSALGAADLWCGGAPVLGPLQPLAAGAWNKNASPILKIMGA